MKLEKTFGDVEKKHASNFEGSPEAARRHQLASGDLAFCNGSCQEAVVVVVFAVVGKVDFNFLQASPPESLKGPFQMLSHGSSS
jgi:hypothetical protein